MRTGEMPMAAWLTGRFTKVCVHTKTCCAIGFAWIENVEDVDAITGKLALR